MRGIDLPILVALDASLHRRHSPHRCQLGNCIMGHQISTRMTVYSILLGCGCLTGPCMASEPRVLVPDFELIQIAAAPDIVTPIAVIYDTRNNLLVIESHTH